MARSSRWLLLLFPSVCLSGCQAPERVALCPAVVSYSAQDQKALLAELQAGRQAALPQEQTYRFLRDYGKQRAALRALCPHS